jgi:hypothetical protein
LVGVSLVMKECSCVFCIFFGRGRKKEEDKGKKKGGGVEFFFPPPSMLTTHARGY